jgi:hypothetical protein
MPGQALAVEHDFLECPVQRADDDLQYPMVDGVVVLLWGPSTDFPMHGVLQHDHPRLFQVGEARTSVDLSGSDREDGGNYLNALMHSRTCRHLHLTLNAPNVFRLIPKVKDCTALLVRGAVSQTWFYLKRDGFLRSLASIPHTRPTACA